MSGTRLCGILLSGGLLLWCLDAPALEDVPPGVRVSGILRNASKEAVTGTVQVVFRVYADGVCTPDTEAAPDFNGRCLLWVGLPQNVVAVDGAFSATVPSADEMLANPDWQSWFTNRTTPPYLGIAVAGQTAGRYPIGAAGFAVQSRHAEEADMAYDVACPGCVNGSAVASGAISDRNVNSAAAISASKLTGVALSGHGHTGYLLANPASAQPAYVWLSGSVTSPRFIDQTNQSYFIDPLPLSGTQSAQFRGPVLIGPTNPLAPPPADTLLSVGTTGQFQVDTLGQVTIAGVPYDWPAAVGAGGLFLYNDGTGALSWQDPIPATGTGFVARTAAPNALATRRITGATGQISVANDDGTAGNPTLSIASNPNFPGTGALGLPSGNLAARPASLTPGTLRYNNQDPVNPVLEYWDGANWMIVAPLSTALDAMPIGTIIPFAGTQPPATWEVCDGRSMPRTLTGGGNDPLYDAIGLAWGAVDGTHFNLPDLQGQFVRGVDTIPDVDTERAGRTRKPNASTGSWVGTYQLSSNPDHTHLAALTAPQGASFQNLVCRPAAADEAQFSSATDVFVPGAADSLFSNNGLAANIDHIARPAQRFVQADQRNPTGEEVPANAAVTWIIRSRTCDNGQCNALCQQGFADCDGVPENGCETAMNTVQNCGGCGLACELAHASESCTTGSCLLTTCDNFPSTSRPSYGNCDGQNDNGCEVSLAQVSNCGGCGTVCTRAHATPNCPNGLCIIGVCDSAWGDCDTQDPNGCETSLRTNSNCNGCGVTCSRANASSTCATQACKIDTCNSNWGNCDNTDPNGCETNLLTTTEHCGACGAPCSTTHSTPTCSGGLCQNSCASGWGNCNGTSQNDGCETTLNDVAHCGSCTNVCSTNHATAYCPSGVCQPVCVGLWGNCNDNATNNDGCETGLSDGSVPGSAINHCGSCLKQCSTNHQQVVCPSGSCVRSGPCEAFWGDCVGGVDDGCETSLKDNANCGGCGVLCSNLPHAAGGGTSVTCGSGTCQPASCDWGYQNCNGLGPDGCEFNYMDYPVAFPGTYIGHGCADRELIDPIHGAFCTDVGWTTSFSGGAAAGSYSGGRSAFFYLGLDDCGGNWPCNEDNVGRAYLYPPADADYDLYIYDMSHNQLAASVAGTGAVDAIEFSSGGSSQRVVEVRFFSAASCGKTWTLTIERKNY